MILRLQSPCEAKAEYGFGTVPKELRLLKKSLHAAFLRC